MQPSIHILLCSPRGFCAGVARAVAMVEAALAKHGAPVYVRHEIVHNRTVVERLRAKGAVFVEELKDIPTPDRPVVFSAHGVSKQVEEEAAAHGFKVVDATCPLVSKVHHEAEVLHAQGFHLLMIGHAGHPEVVGTMGQVPGGAVTLVQTPAEARHVAPPPGPLALITQTTLSVTETAETIAVLQQRFPQLKLPKKADICYATTNRQEAIRQTAPRCDLFLIVGAPNSSNSRQLVAAALGSGCPRAQLVQTVDEVKALDLSAVKTLGLSAGASAPEDIVQAIIAHLQQTRAATLEEVTTAVEDQVFKIPQSLQAG